MLIAVPRHEAYTTCASARKAGCAGLACLDFVYQTWFAPLNRSCGLLNGSFVLVTEPTIDLIATGFEVLPLGACQTPPLELFVDAISNSFEMLGIERRRVVTLVSWLSFTGSPAHDALLLGWICAISCVGLSCSVLLDTRRWPDRQSTVCEIGRTGCHC